MKRKLFRSMVAMVCSLTLLLGVTVYCEEPAVMPTCLASEQIEIY